jgi:hypothetical protein
MGYQPGDLSLVVGGTTYVVNAGSLSSFQVRSPAGGIIQVSPALAAELYGDYQAVRYLNKIMSSQSVSQTISGWDDVQSTVRTIVLEQTGLDLLADVPALSVEWEVGDYSELAKTLALDAVKYAPPIVEMLITDLATNVAEAQLTSAEQNYQNYILGKTGAAAISATTIEATISAVVTASTIGDNAATAADKIPGVNLNQSPWDTFLGWVQGLSSSLLGLGNKEVNSLSDVSSLINQLDPNTVSSIQGMVQVADLMSQWSDIGDAADFASIASQLSSNSSFYLLSDAGELATAANLAGNPSVAPASTVNQIKFSVAPDLWPVSESHNTLNFTLTRSDSSAQSTVYVSTVPDQGTLNTGFYYYNGVVSQPLTFLAGHNTASYQLSINDEHLTAGSETFRLIVQASSNDSSTTHYLAATSFKIVNDDAMPSTYTIATSTPVVNESDRVIRFTVSRSSSAQSEIVYVSTVHDQGSANPGGNLYYQGVLNQKVIFGVGQLTVPIAVTINDLGLISGSETFRLIAQQNPSDSLTKSLASANFTINNADVAPSYEISPAPASVPENGAPIVFSITRLGSTTSAEYVYVSTVPNIDTNTNDNYYDDLTRVPVYFPANQSTETAPQINIHDRGLTTGSETFGFIVQRSPTDQTNVANTTFTINNTDTAPKILSGSLTGTTVTTGTTTLGDVDLLGGAVLQNTGTLIVISAVGGDGNSGNTINNLAGATIDIQSNSYSKVPNFNNAGHVVVALGTGNFKTIEGLFNNTGTVQVQSGTFNIYQGGSSGASGFTVAAGATLLFTGANAHPFTFTGGTYSVAGTTVIGDAAFGGVVVFAAGTTINVGSSWTIDGTLDLSAATIAGTFNGLVMGANLSADLLLGAADTTIAALNMQGSNLVDTGLLTLTGTSSADGGFEGDGVVNNIGTLGVSSSLALSNGEVLENGGTINLSGSLTGGAAVDNLSGATLNLSNGVLGTGTINNAGMLNITSTFTRISGFLNNSGIIGVRSGMVFLQGGGTSGLAGYQVAAGATLNFSSGTYTFTGGSYNVSGSTGIGGTWKVAGTATIDSVVDNSGTIEAETGTLTLNKAVSDSGTIILDKNVTLALASPASFKNSISGFGSSNTIDLLGVSATAAFVNGSNQLVVSNSGTTVATLQLSGIIPAGPFSLTSDGLGGSDIALASGSPSEASSIFSYDSAGRVTSQTLINSDGSKSVSNYDATNLEPWASQVAVFDATGNVVSQVITNDNGTQWTNVYDTSGAAAWTWYSDAYDANGNLTSQTGQNRDGTYWLTMYDVANTYSWSNATIGFDANWNMTSLSGTRDDGSHALTMRDLATAYDTLAWFPRPYDVNWNSGPNYTVLAGGTIELSFGQGLGGAVTFAGPTGTLILDQSTSFAGAIVGLRGQDKLDFADISFAALHQPTYAGTSAGGTLTLVDGTHTANIALVGNYLSSSFVPSDDGHGGTFLVDPLLDAATSATVIQSPVASMDISSAVGELPSAHIGLLANYMASAFAEGDLGQVGVGSPNASLCPEPMPLTRPDNHGMPVVTDAIYHV